MTRLVHDGYSWSGRERDCCFLNLRDGSFVDVSALSGADYPDDGRAVAATDWDGDGDLDLWVKNRNGPVLRFLRNDAPADAHWVAFQLVGKTCNRDAIGARVEVAAGGRKRVRWLVAGDGYLSQSSKHVHFGLGHDERIERLVVQWPGGERTELDDLAADHVYRIEQGRPKPELLAARSIQLPEGPAGNAADPPAARTVLRVPLALPPSLLAQLRPFQPTDRTTLVCLWASWCAPCLAELRSLAENRAEIARAGLHVVALNVDRNQEQPRALQQFSERLGKEWKSPAFHERAATAELMETLDAVIRHVRDNEGLAALPTSLLIDRAGSLQLLYTGPANIPSLLEDAKRFGPDAVPAHQRGGFPGRWYFRIPRNLPELARDLQKRGRQEEAGFYRGLSRNPDLPGMGP